MAAAKKHKVLVIAVFVLIILVAASAIYLNTYYHASNDAVMTAALYSQDTEAGNREVYLFKAANCSDPQSSGNGAFESAPFAENHGCPAIVFYPGGKVQCEAYAPLCKALADRGITCALIKMPFNLAVFDADAAGPAMGLILEQCGCTEYYLAGHSLGGAMAARYALSICSSADSAEKPVGSTPLKGLILLASYSDKGLHGTGLRALSIYGSLDGVLSLDKYKEALSNMPADFTELVIPGGIHSYFGDYGLQKSDGIPGISREEQISQTADAIAKWIAE